METLQINQTKKTQAEIKVLSLNTLYEYAAKIVEYELNHFKVDGSLKAKYEHEKLYFKGKLEDGTFCTVDYYYKKGYTAFDLQIRCCVNGGSYDVKPNTAFCEYENLTTSLFELQNNILIDNTPDHSYLNKRYDLNIIAAKARELHQLADAYNAAKATFPYQFENSFYIQRLTR